jgi:hypothetical protein
VTSAPAWAANALTTAPPARKLATIWAVTSCGQGLTPWACTPWSAGEHRHAGRLGQRRRAAAGQAGQPDGHLFELAQRAARLGHPVLPFARGGHRRRVGRGDRGDHVGQRIHWFLPWQSAAAELLGVHRPGHRPAARPAGRGEFRFRREL